MAEVGMVIRRVLFVLLAVSAALTVRVVQQRLFKRTAPEMYVDLSLISPSAFNDPDGHFI